MLIDNINFIQNLLAPVTKFLHICVPTIFTSYSYVCVANYKIVKCVRLLCSHKMYRGITYKFKSICWSGADPSYRGWLGTYIIRKQCMAYPFMNSERGFNIFIVQRKLLQDNSP